MILWKSLRVRPLTLLAVLSLAFGASAADNSLEAVYKRMDAAAAKFKGLTADMTRLSHEGAIGEEETDTGTIAVKVPKPHDFHILMQFKQPEEKAVEVSGSKVQLYYPKAAEVQELDFGRSHKAQIEQFVKLGFGSSSSDIQDGYKVEYGGPEAINGQPSTRIVLTPKSQELAAQFPKFELWISDATGIAIQQKIYQPGKTYNIATYSHMKLDPNVPDSAVKLNLPKGVKHTHLQR